MASCDDRGTDANSSVIARRNRSVSMSSNE
jgi:hypothetical protein